MQELLVGETFDRKQISHSLSKVGIKIFKPCNHPYKELWPNDKKTAR